MTATTVVSADDPPRNDQADAFLRDSNVLAPLKATRFSVTIRDGVAKVETWRTFRNADSRPIEVLLTMPMPIRAVLYELILENEGRIFEATCLSREPAVKTYEEDGVSEGKLTVLYEELLPGIHKLQIANIARGAEVSVKSTWAIFLAPSRDGRARFRLPLTVGDVYGCSPLSDADDLLTGGPLMWGHLSVDGDDVEVFSGGKLVAAPLDVPLDRPLDFAVPMRPLAQLRARAADGRLISLSLALERVNDSGLDAAILIDRSSSMADPCSSAGRSLSKFDAVREGLTEAVRHLTAADRLHLFAFSDGCEDLGVFNTWAACAAALKAANGPDGGTEIGRSLQTVMARSPARDIVLITDGQSYAMDISALLRSGRRFTVVLIGDDSLEARIGELAASSGGAVLVAPGHAVAEAVAAALAAIRSPHTIEPTLELPLRSLKARRDGLSIDVRWTDGDAPASPALSDAVRALATALALPRLSGSEAEKLAVDEGLLGRATSLVFVDKASATQEGLPVTYKQPLAKPAISPLISSTPRQRNPSPQAEPAAMMREAAPARAAPPPSPPVSLPSAAPMMRDWFEWPNIDQEVWNLHGTELSNGDVDQLPKQLAELIVKFSEKPEIKNIIDRLDPDRPILLAIAILAWHTETTRSNRVAKAIYKGQAAETMLSDAVSSLRRLEFPLSRRRNS